MRENEKDIAAAEAADTESHLLNRLKMKPGKIAQLAAGARQIADMEEPLGRQLSKMKVADGLTLEQVTAPLGVLLIIFESRPDALPQIASLAIRSGNGLLLKGGKEAAKTNAILHQIIVDCMPAFGVDRECIVLVEGREAVSDILALHDVVDLVIPRGSNSLVSYISNNTKIPVLATRTACATCTWTQTPTSRWRLSLRLIPKLPGCFQRARDPARAQIPDRQG